MTSQHFGTEEGWDDWSEWGGENNGTSNNNNNPQIQQVPSAQPTQQHQSFIQQPASNVPLYSPFAYQQQQQPTHLPAAPIPPMSHQQPAQQQYSSPQFFNNSNFTDNVNNNPPIQANVIQGSVFADSMTSAAPPSVAPPPQTPYIDKARNFKVNNGHQEESKRTSMNPLPYQPRQPTATSVGYQQQQQTFMPSPSTSPMQLPPPPQVESTTQDLYTSNQLKNLPAPPAAIPNYESNFARQSAEQNFQPTNWPPQQQAPVSNTNPFSMNQPPQNWQTPISQQQIYSHAQQPPASHSSPVNHMSNSFNASAQDPFRNHQPFHDFAAQSTPQMGTSESFAHGTDARLFDYEESENLAQPEAAINFSIFPPSVAPNLQPVKQENVENIQPELVQPVPVTTLHPETFYPENRERLDDISTPPTSSASFTDRHNYLVTGQLSQERMVVPSPQHPQAPMQHHQVRLDGSANFTEEFPPPGLSRMVVGQPETNRDQPTAADILPPGLNRMVTGTETSSSNYINYQRQADGEVSQPPLALQRPQSNSPFTSHHHNQHNVVEVAQPNFNTTDRNLYLVAGESDVNNQRVIPGVESDNSLPPIIMNPMQNLHIQDDDDFVNVSVSAQERNVNVDGMETAPEGQQQQRSIDAEPREEDIDGANDNTESFNAPPSISIHDHGAAINEPESDVREEAIEGANDYNDEVGKSVELNKVKKPEMSSDDSELRALNTSKSKPKPRRSKKYADDSNESENDFSGSDHRRRQNREKISREDYEKNRRKDKERRSGERPRRGDDTDGSKYDVRRRTDDEDDSRRNRDKYKKNSRSRNQDDVEPDDKEKKKRDKYRESGSRRKDYAYDDERRERRRRDGYYENESHSGRRSQNTSDREYASDRYNRRSRDHVEKDRKYDANSYYQQYPGYDPNYNYNSYYQHQQYYETLRRTNPQAYYEWYTKYYSMMQQQSQQQHQQQPPTAIDDISGSLRSGYNSSNEKDRASSSLFLPGGHMSNPMRSMNSSFIDNTDYQSLQAHSHYNHGYDFSRDNSGKTTEIQRSTPKKFQCLHDFVRLSNGVMTTIDTTNSDNGYIVKIQNVPMNDKARRLYQSYPGPLVRGVSHKKTVIGFCEEKLKQDQLIAVSQRASYSLLWGFLILMLRQNGNYTEGDVSELLMKNSSDFKSSLDTAPSLDDNKNATNNEEDNTDVSENEENMNSEKNSQSASQSHEEMTTNSSLSEKVVLHKFRDYLLYGNINDALDFATDNNLWGHALFLASKVDRRQHANVMLKFANKLPYNDPLQTLYQIMSGRMPACVSHLDDKWGDWRPHLAMIISNCTDKPELVKRSIMTLGDSLASRGDIFASQFCYLLVEPLFTDFGDTGKTVLLGTSHQKPFKEFATDDAIIMTEVYEYARSLSDEHFFVPTLQKYKFLLAGQMLDYGMQLKCLLYMEQIAKCIVVDPSAFDKNFIAKVYSLADRLKFYDPVMEKSYEDNFNNNNGFDATEDQKWLQELGLMLQSFDENLSYQPVQEQTPQSNEIYNPMSFNQSAPVSTGIYDPMSQQQSPTHSATTNNYEEEQQPLLLSQEQPPPMESYNQNQFQQPAQDQSYSYEYNNSIASENQSQQLAHQLPYDPNAHINYQQQPTTQTDYGYGWEQNSYQQQQPTITMGNSVSKQFENSSAPSESNKENDEKKKSPMKKPEVAKKNQEGSAQPSSGWFGGIFNKLSMKPKNQMILPDDKNPTILWDEATKKWVNKDGDGAETESFKPPPKMGDMMGGGVKMPQPNMPPQQQPQYQQQQQQQEPQQPAMTQMNQYPQSMPQPQQPMPQMDNMNHAQQHQPQMPNQSMQVNSIISAPEGQQPPAPSAPNMFKMQKGRNLKKSYVDILGNSGQTVSQPKELAPQMDMQFFNPIQQQTQGMQFYNPNDFQGN